MIKEINTLLNKAEKEEDIEQKFNFFNKAIHLAQEAIRKVRSRIKKTGCYNYASMEYTLSICYSEKWRNLLDYYDTLGPSILEEEIQRFHQEKVLWTKANNQCKKYYRQKNTPSFNKAINVVIKLERETISNRDALQRLFVKSIERAAIEGIEKVAAERAAAEKVAAEKAAAEKVAAEKAAAEKAAAEKTAAEKAAAEKVAAEKAAAEKAAAEKAAAERAATERAAAERAAAERAAAEKALAIEYENLSVALEQCSEGIRSSNQRGLSTIHAANERNSLERILAEKITLEPVKNKEESRKRKKPTSISHATSSLTFFPPPTQIKIVRDSAVPLRGISKDILSRKEKNRLLDLFKDYEKEATLLYDPVNNTVEVEAAPY